MFGNFVERNKPRQEEVLCYPYREEPELVPAAFLVEEKCNITKVKRREEENQWFMIRPLKGYGCQGKWQNRNFPKTVQN